MLSNWKLVKLNRNINHQLPNLSANIPAMPTKSKVETVRNGAYGGLMPYSMTHDLYQDLTGFQKQANAVFHESGLITVSEKPYL